ncbi:MAG: DMT family transporter [Ferrovum sp.]|jgi:drug/metabolite transporter (DMT)-like permease|nr:DMT family transporter [Ferrovum sp.]
MEGTNAAINTRISPARDLSSGVEEPLPSGEKRMLEKQVHLHHSYLRLIGAMALWGGVPVVMKATLSGLNPATFNFFRYLLALTILFPLLKHSRVPRVPIRVKAYLMLLGACTLFPYSELFLIGLEHTSAATAGLLSGLTPVIVLLLGLLLRMEQPTWRIIIGMLVSYAGVYYFISTGQPATGTTHGDFYGVFLISLAVIAFSIYSVSNSKHSRNYPSLVVTTYVFLGTFLAFIPATIWDWWTQPAQHVGLANVAGILYMSVPASVIGYLWFSHGARALGAYKSSLFLNLVPVFAVAFSILFLQERLASRQWLGVLVILAGIFLTQVSRVPHPPKV